MPGAWEQWEQVARRRLRRLLWQGIRRLPPRDITVESFNGRLTFSNRERVIGHELFVNRSYETEVMREALELLRKEGFLRRGNTLIDVGANIGMTSIALLRHGHFEHALAFEPGPDNYRRLVHNIGQNGLAGRIRHFDCALSSSAGELELEFSEVNSGDHRIRSTRSAGAFSEESRATATVSVRTLDQALAGLTADSFDPRQVALIWLDVQGHEGHVLKGAAQLLRRPIPAVSEFWPYAILRSGMARGEFCAILARYFAHFYVYPAEPRVKLPISSLDALFDAYADPARFCQLILLPAV